MTLYIFMSGSVGCCSGGLCGRERTARRLGD